jgi:propionyl-CoA carboxylase alpha chain
VRYRFDRADRLQELWVDDQPLALDDDTLISLERTPVVLHDDIAYVRGGVTRFQIPPRFTSPDEAGREGSTVAPMPGRVIALLVAVGDTVVAGQPLLTMEAMKMEHQIVSPHPGIIGEVYIQPGQQLDSGQPLLTVDPA